MPIYRSLATPPMPAAGQYAWPAMPGTASGTSAALNNGVLRLFPWLVTRSCKLDRIGTEIVTGTTADAGTLYRLGIYGDNGNAYPGALALDCGTIAADVVGVFDATIAATLAPGLYWIGGAVQANVTVQPTIRVLGTSWTPPVPLAAGAAQPTASMAGLGYLQTAVTGALPANFTATPVSSGNVPRLHVRFA